MQRKLLRISFKVFKTCYHIFENLPKDFTCCNHMLGHVLVETCAIFCVEARFKHTQYFGTMWPRRYSPGAPRELEKIVLHGNARLRLSLPVYTCSETVIYMLLR
jgi:hypothetical protein